jgi:DNA-binding NtrC family response regulator
MDPSQISILILDPSRLFQSRLEATLDKSRYQVICVQTETSALKKASLNLPNIVIKSYVKNQSEEHGLMERIWEICPDTEFIFLSPDSNIHMAMSAIHRGAYDCLPWPCENHLMMESIRRALEHQALVAEHPEIKRRLMRKDAPNILAGRSKVLQEIQRTLEQVASTDVTVLIQGKSGTGKELVARALHEMSQRKNGPFIAVNCAALPQTIIESEFFGHVRGAFTGASTDKPGRFELARRGTLFLDEIGDLSLQGQADLLRVLEDGVFRPIGSKNTVQSNARIVAATNRDLESLCSEGLFREDLFYRLNVICINLPPLCDRPEDILVLAEVFCKHFCAKHQRSLKKISTDLGLLLQGLAWPGNVRQLRNTMERMVLTVNERTLHPRHLPIHLQDQRDLPSSVSIPSGMTLAAVEAELIRITLLRCGDNRTQSANLLGISRRSLHYKLQKLENQKNDDLKGV